MKKRILCALMALALFLSSPVARAAGADMALEVAGVAGDSPYLVCGELTATAEDYIRAVADVGTGLFAACTQREVPFQRSPVSLELPGVFSVQKKGGFLWDNTIDGVPFDRYLEERAQVLAFYRAWSESGLAPQSTAESFETWSRESGYLRFAYFPVNEEDSARAVYEALCRGEELESLWGRYSVTPEAPREYTGTPELFLPGVAELLEEAPLGVWQEPVWMDNGYHPHWAVLRRLPLTPEVHRQALLEEAWPTAMEGRDIHLAPGAEKLEAAALYETWFSWAIAHNQLIATTRWTTVSDEAVILPAGGIQEAEKTTFSDVAEDDWFAPYVAACVEEGLMEGTGEGRFDPQRELTVAEVLVLGARFLSHVREEPLPALPEDIFDLAVFYDADGERLADARDLARQPVAGAGSVYLTSFREEVLDRARQRPVTLVLELDGLDAYSQWFSSGFYGADDLRGSKTYTGTWDGTCYGFDLGDDFGGYGPEFLLSLFSFVNVGALLQNQGGGWYRDELLSLVNDPRLEDDFLAGHQPPSPGQGDWFHTEPAQRADLVCLLALGADDLDLAPGTQTDGISSLEELQILSEQGGFFVYALYRAGVLTGVDETGAFAGERTLTRAETAAILARTLRPQLRVEAAPADPAAIFGRETE